MNTLLQVPTKSFTEEYAELFSSPAHWAFELTFSVIFDIIVIALIYGVIIKKIIIPRLKSKLTAEISKEHERALREKEGVHAAEAE